VPSWLRTFRGSLGAVAAGGLGLRLALVHLWSGGLTPEGDQLWYLRQAQYLGQGFGFVYRNPMLALGAPAGGYSELVPTAVHPPLYTAWLGLVALARVAAPDGHVPFRLAAALLGVGTIVAVGLAGRRLAGGRAGLVAAALVAVHPNLWVNDVLLFSESMYALTIGLVLLASVSFVADRSNRNAAFLGATVALAALARAEALLLVVLLVVPLVLWARTGAAPGPPVPVRRRLRHLAVAGTVTAVVVAPWVVRNALTFSRHPLTVSNGTGYVVEMSNCDQTYGEVPPTDGQGHLLADAPTDGLLGYWAVECDRTPWVAGDETETGAVKLQAGLDYISAHRGRFPVVLAARVGRLWDVWRPDQSRELNAYLEGRGPVVAVAGLAAWYPLALLGVAGLVVLRRRRQPLTPYLALAALTTLTAAVSFGITRYRVGAEVALTLLAGVAVDALLRRRGAGRRAVPARHDADPAPAPEPPALAVPS
jgi:hypothetical protein